jgi:Sulfotransferase family
MTDRFDPRQIEQDAVESTGLEDFGADGWRDPFARLIEAADNEARLSETGRAITALQFHDRLVNRLEIQDHLRRHPEVHDEVIETPLILATLPRTGQTAAGWILDRDPANRSLLRWFAKRPCPPPDPRADGVDPRIVQERAMISAMPQELLDMHLSDAEEPDECHWLLSNDFRIPHEIYAMRVPTYYQWVRDDPGIRDTYEYYAIQLRLLQSRLPPARWVLKNSPHLLFLDALQAVMPDAIFVQFHRDPAKVLASNCRLSLLLRSMYSDDVDAAEVGESMLALLGDYVARLLRFRTAGTSRPWIDIRFPDFVADPLREIERIYDEAGLTLTAEARQGMARWVLDNPRRDLQRARPAYLSPYGLDMSRVRATFADYLDAFPVQFDGI